MAYVSPNFKSKKALKEAIKAGQTVTVFGVGPFSEGKKHEGKVTVEGPHYPEPHKWYGQVIVENGKIVKVVA